MGMDRKLGVAVLCALTAVSAVLFDSCKSGADMTRQREQAVGQGRSIVVLYENDVHCNIDGYARLAGLRDAIGDTACVAVVSCGDFLQGGTAGAISKGQYVVDVMRSVGYDAVTLGNHEFDYKTPRMFSLVSSLQSPVTCVNLRRLSDGSFPFAPYVIKDMAGKKVAFVGVTTPTTIATEEYAFFDESGKQLFEFCPEATYDLVQKAVDGARADGADYVVVLAHLGEDPNDFNVDSHGLIRNTTGVDVVLDGHTHSVIPSDTVHNGLGTPVLISETGTKFANIGKLIITADGHMTTRLIPTEEVEYSNRTVRQVTDSVKALEKKETDVTVCTSDVKLVIYDADGKQEVRKGETNAGDLVADAYRDMTGADFALTNGGGIRSELSEGTLTYGDIISLLPYDSYVCTVEITGAQLVELLGACTQSVPQESGDFPQVSGLKFTVNKGDRRVSDIMVENKATGDFEPLESGRTYQLATIDYCVTGGGFMGLLKHNKVTKLTGVNYCDCLIRYLRQTLQGHIGKRYADPQGRITIKY